MAVFAVPIGSQIIDTDSVIDRSRAASLVTRGANGVIRYLSRTNETQAGDLTAAEAAVIIDAGLRLMAVQHYGFPGRWIPSPALGKERGGAAVTNARAIGIPPGVTVALDLEMPFPGGDKHALAAYANAWSAELLAVGYEPMLYIGAGLPPMTADDLFWLFSARLYWRSASQVPDVAVRGYAMRQSLPRLIAGIACDQNVVCGDALYGVPHWWSGN